MKGIPRPGPYLDGPGRCTRSQNQGPGFVLSFLEGSKNRDPVDKRGSVDLVHVLRDPVDAPWSTEGF